MVEGVVLQAVPYQDHHHIVTLFSPEGLMRLFVRGHVRKSSHALVTPLNRISFTYTAKENKLGRLQEGKVLDHHLALRKHFDKLEAGCQLAQGLLATQMVGKATPKLYQLFLTYLAEIGEKFSGALVSSFLLKLLKHEGLLHLHTHCARCEEELDEIHVEGSEAYCGQHAPEGSIHFAEEERAVLLQIVASRSLKDIVNFDVSPSLKKRVDQLFGGLIGASD